MTRSPPPRSYSGNVDSGRRRRGQGADRGGVRQLALAALRAARRSEHSLEAAAQGMHEAVHDVSRPVFVTAIVGRWHAVYSTFSWINCGHPPPLLAHADGKIEQLLTESNLPLGLFDRQRRFSRHQRRLDGRARLILHSDGVTARRTEDGLFGLDGIERAVHRAPGSSAATLAKSIQKEVMSASVDKLQDDAVAVVLGPTLESADSGSGSR